MQTRKKKDNRVEPQVQNLSYGSPIHRRNNIRYYMAEKYIRQCNRCKTENG